MISDLYQHFNIKMSSYNFHNIYVTILASNSLLSSYSVLVLCILKCNTRHKKNNFYEVTVERFSRYILDSTRRIRKKILVIKIINVIIYNLNPVNSDDNGVHIPPKS